MKMSYYIRNDSTYCFLNKKNGWNRSINTYGLMAFDTEEAAKTAIPSDKECTIIAKEKKDPPSDVEWILQFNKKTLNKKNEFEGMSSFAEAMRFADEDAAVTKAEELKLDLEKIKVSSVEKTDKKTK